MPDNDKRAATATSSFRANCSSSLFISAVCSTQNMPWYWGTADYICCHAPHARQCTHDRQLCDTVLESMTSAIVAKMAGASRTLTV